MDEYKAKENEFDIAMTEILKENFDTKTQGKDVEEMLYSNDDKIQQLLLDYYNTYDSRHDFQTDLIRSLAVKLKLNEEEVSLLTTIKSNSNVRDDDYLMVNSKTIENSFCLENWIRHTFGNL